MKLHELLQAYIISALEDKEDYSLSFVELHQELQNAFEFHFDVALESLVETQDVSIVNDTVYLVAKDV
jgi:hypothetical protein